jgi:DNA helicase HerA-like ATPase
VSLRKSCKARLDKLGIEDWQPRANPVMFWDVFGAAGHPVRATISDMGPLLLGRLLNLNDTQGGVLQLVFKIADDQGLLLLDLKDLRAMVQHVGENAAEYKTKYGNVSAASIGAIQRGLLTLEEQGGDSFFGEPMLDIEDLMQTQDGRGVINVLAADKLMNSPATLRLLPALAAGRVVRATAGGRRPAQAQAGLSSSTRPISCSTTRRPRCWKRSSRWSA